MEVFDLVENLEFDKNKQLLVTMDITSLYTRIPQEEALVVICEIQERRERPHFVPILS